METSDIKRFAANAQENRGRVLLLFLLFLLSIYQLVKSGVNGMALLCMLPVSILFIVAVFRWRMFTFWLLFIVNYTVMGLNRYNYMPLPSSIPNEMLSILLILIALIDSKIIAQARTVNLMGICIGFWCAFCTLELLNDTCALGINVGAWYQGARLMAFQMLYAYLVCSLYINTPKLLKQFMKMWAVCSLCAAYWAWQQKTLGFTATEKSWLVYAGRTHMVNGIIRYFSFFTDAANFGINMAASSVVFYILAITGKIKRERLFYLATGLFCTWAMFTSGTRTAVFCMIAGFCLYIVLSKSVKIAVPVLLVFGTLVCILAFTKIGDGNSMVRRMRSAFDRNDASAGVRDINKDAIRKYIKDAPWGIGIGIGNYSNIPSNNKYQKLSMIPPDSEYVFIWVHTGIIGITVFVMLTAIMLAGGCITAMFRLKSKSLQGLASGICCGFVSIQLGGYGNQILMQFPNVLLFYGGLALVYTMPYMEKAWIEDENMRLEKQEERKRLKEKKKREKRV